MNDQDASLLMEERKLHYLNRSASAQTKEQRAAVEAEFVDVVEFMVAETSTLSALVKAPKPKATASNKEPRDAAEAAASFGAIAVALAGLQASTVEELKTIIGEAGALFVKRNPDASTADLAALLGFASAAPAAPAFEGEEFFLAEEAGAYQNPDQSIVKFAIGDKLFMSADGLMRVEAYIPDDATSLNWQDMSKLAKSLGSSARSKGAVEAFVAEKLKERQEIIANIADPE